MVMQGDVTNTKATFWAIFRYGLPFCEISEKLKQNWLNHDSDNYFYFLVVSLPFSANICT